MMRKDTKTGLSTECRVKIGTYTSHRLRLVVRPVLSKPLATAGDERDQE